MKQFYRGVYLVVRGDFKGSGLKVVGDDIGFSATSPAGGRAA